MKPNMLFILFNFFFLLIMNSCSPSKEMSTELIPAIKNFDLNRYLGNWYEIARLPHSFENGLDSVTATYSLRDDGMVKVVNKGFNTVKGEWQEAIGKARFKGDSNIGYLEVSFFWIFYGDYKVIDLDTVNYSYAVITSRSKKYFWILNREPKMDEEKYNELITKARDWGFDVQSIYKVAQR